MLKTYRTSTLNLPVFASPIGCVGKRLAECGGCKIGLPFVGSFGLLDELTRWSKQIDDAKDFTSRADSFVALPTR